MDDKEKIQSFGDMVEAAESLTRPWRKALALTNILWAVIVALLVWFAYMTPTDVYQTQELPEQTQVQHYSDGFGSNAPYAMDGE